MRAPVGALLSAVVFCASLCSYPQNSQAQPDEDSIKHFIDGVYTVLRRMHDSHVARFQMSCENGCRTRGEVQVAVPGSAHGASIRWACDNNLCDIDLNGALLRGVPQDCRAGRVCIRSEKVCDRHFKIAAQSRWMMFDRTDCDGDGFIISIRDSESRAESFRCVAKGSGLSINNVRQLTCNRMP